MREVVGDRQRFGALEQQRVVERDRRRLEQHAHRAQHARRQRGSRADGAIEPDERADAAAAALKRKRHDRADERSCTRGSCADRRSRTRAALHHPRRRWRRSPAHVRRQAAIGEHRQLPRTDRPTPRPSTAPAPTSPRARRRLGNFRRFECGVDGADDVEQRVAALDAAAQRALKHAQLGREIEARRAQARFRRRGAVSCRSFRRARPRDRARPASAWRDWLVASVSASILCKYTIRPPVTACHAVSSWHTMGVSRSSRLSASSYQLSVGARAPRVLRALGQLRTDS